MGIVLILGVAVALFFGVQVLLRGDKQTANRKAYTALVVMTAVTLAVVIVSGALRSDPIGLIGSFVALAVLVVLMQPVFVQLQKKIEDRRHGAKE